MWNDRIKFHKAISELKDSAEFSFSGTIPTNAEEYKKVKWKSGVDADGITIDTTTNPHSELTWSAVNAEMTRLQTEYDSLDYARKRQREYPTIEELVVALYDTEDKLAIENKRAEVKAKHPK